MYRINILKNRQPLNMQKQMALLNMCKQAQLNGLKKNKNKLNAKSVMQTKVNYITGHRSIYSQMQKNGQHLIFAAPATNAGMIL